MPAFFIQDYALQKGIMDEDLASYLLPILNACSILGRIAPNIISDRIGGLNVLVPAVSIATVLTFAWISITTTAGCIIFSCLYGLAIGCILSLPPFVIASLCNDRKTIGARLGNSFAVASFGLLLGPPVAAAILQSGSWIGTQLFAAGMLTVASLALVFVRVFIAGPRLLRKV
jgi:MFS family permease